MCFLFLGDEFSATALLSEETEIKNTYTDGTSFYACIIKYVPPHCPLNHMVTDIISGILRTALSASVTSASFGILTVMMIFITPSLFR